MGGDCYGIRHSLISKRGGWLRSLRAIFIPRKTDGRGGAKLDGRRALWVPPFSPEERGQGTRDSTSEGFLGRLPFSRRNGGGLRRGAEEDGRGAARVVIISP